MKINYDNLCKIGCLFFIIVCIYQVWEMGYDYKLCIIPYLTEISNQDQILEHKQKIFEIERRISRIERRHTALSHRLHVRENKSRILLLY